MITTIEAFKKSRINEDHYKNDGLNNSEDISNQLNPVNNPSKLIPPSEDMVNNFSEIKKIADYAVSMGLSKEATKKLIHTVFADPSQAPDEISITFVQDHMGEIINAIDTMPDTDFPENEYNFTDDMTSNILPFECVMYAKDSHILEKLAFSLNEKIKRNNFKAIYENGVFFINTLDGMSDDNKKIIANILESAKAINISNNIKWKRKIK